MMSHIRRASQGALTHANTQPFARELDGRMHTFAHNGDLRGLAGLVGAGPQRFNPVGETNSELAFCILLERMTTLSGGRQVALAEASTGGGRSLRRRHPRPRTSQFSVFRR